MNKFLVIFNIVMMSSFCYARPDIIISYERTDNGYTILAKNKEYCAVSIKLMLTLNNLRSSEGNNKVFVIPAQSKAFVITTLNRTNRSSYSFKYEYNSTYGDHYQSEHDETYVYHLPYSSSSSYLLFQGYNGATTHKGKNALDFTMPVGTKIHAARAGTVVKVIKHNTKNCKHKDCVKYNNLIMILHEDGTLAEYVHLKQNGSLVKVGDTVARGQHIAYSGNTGFSSGPHLHFEVFKAGNGTKKTLQTKFKIEEGKPTQYLKPKKEYLKAY